MEIGRRPGSGPPGIIQENLNIFSHIAGIFGECDDKASDSGYVEGRNKILYSFLGFLSP